MGGLCERMIGIARFYVAPTKHSSHPWSALYLNGRSHCHYERKTTCTSVHRPGQPPDTLSINTCNAKDPPPPGDFTEKDMYTKQWWQIQALTNQLLTRWWWEYLPCLQHRQKWTALHRNLKVGDVLLLREKQAECNSLPVARITAKMDGKDEVETADTDILQTYCVSCFTSPKRGVEGLIWTPCIQGLVTSPRSGRECDVYKI